MPDLRFSK